MSAYQPEVPVDDETLEHSNGALGIKKIEISTCQWESIYHDYARLLGVTPKIVNSVGEATFFRFTVLLSI